MASNPLWDVLFQSTLPVGGATFKLRIKHGESFISIHAPRGGSDDYSSAQALRAGISIHAPRGGSDADGNHAHSRERDFNPRSPWGERPLSVLKARPTKGFQSTLPVGGATAKAIQRLHLCEISIHAPRGGSDCQPVAGGDGRPDFNPRSPWGERPLQLPPVRRRKADFNPRSPWGERQLTVNFKPVEPQFQSTLPVGGATSGFG